MRTPIAVVLMVSFVACGGKVLSESTSAANDGDAGAGTGTGDDGGPVLPPSPPTPVGDGGAPFVCGYGVNPGGAGCQVSFTKDLLGKKMGAAGDWGCDVSGCHDPQGGTPPKIDVTDAFYTYQNLFNAGTGALPYVNPCSYSENDSEIIGNLSHPSTAGDHMPKGNTALPSPADLELVRSWVACGSPLN